MNALSVIMAVLVCLLIAAILILQITKVYWGWKSKGESLKPGGEEDKKEKGGKEE